jgi:PAS domain S-box-containing protein/diguanylate cyclase (GGDEF)-like protein
MQNPATEAYLSALIDSTEDYIWAVDLDFRFVTFNRATALSFEGHFGKPLSAGRRHEEQLPLESRATWAGFYQRAISEGPFQTEHTFSDGRTRDLSFNPIVVDGVTTGISVFGKDVTARKAVEAARLEAESKYRTIFDDAIEGIYRATPEGKYLVANPAQAHMLGYDSPEDLIASVKDLSHDVWFDPDERALYKQALEERGEVRGFVCRFKRKDGEIVWFSLNGKRVADFGGRTLYYDGFVEEVTRQKRSEMELQEREERLKQAELLAQMGHSSWDVDSNISTWSEGMYRITGWDLARPAPRHEERALLYSPESLARLNEAVQRTLATGEPYDLEVQITRPDGALRWARVVGQAVRNDIGRIHRLIGTMQDITEQKLSEMTLRDSEERFRATFEQAAVGIIHVSFEGQIARCNQRFADILGYSPDEIVGMRFHQFTPPEYLPESNQILNALEAGNIDERGFEKPYIRKDGSRIWVRLKTSVQRDGKGQPLHLVTFVEDITDRRLAEEHLAAASKELQASEARFRAIFESAAMGCSMVDLEGRYLQSNLALQNILGYSETELLSMTTRHFTHPDDLERDQQLFRELAEGKRTSYETDKRYIRKDGRVVWARVTASLLRDAKGEPQFAVGMVQDITERKLAVEALRERAAQLREAEHIAGLGSSVWDADTDSTTWSPEMYRIRQWDPSEPIPKHADKSPLYTPESWKRQSAAVETAIATGEPYDIELQFVRQDGAIRWGNARGRATYDDAGRVTGMHGTLQDITERKLVEEQIKASEENYLLLLNSTAEGIFGIDMNGVCIFSNPASLRILGYESSEEILGKHMHSLVHHSHADGSPYPAEMCPILTKTREGKGIHVDHEVMWRKDGSSFQAEYWSYPILKGDKQAGAVITFLDITNRKRAEEHLAAASRELQASEVRHRTVFQTSQDALNLSRLSDGRLVDVNKTFLDLTGFQREEVIGRTTVELDIWANPSDRPIIIDELRRNAVIRDMEVLFKRKDGSTFWGLTSASVIEFDGIPHVLVATKDVSEAKDAVKTIRDLAFYDPLTHLPNRRSLLDLLEQAHDDDAGARALLFVDLDNFKSLNDAFGHRAGDLLLQEAAQRLAACVRGEGTVARLGGDEFAIVLENLGNTREHAAERARQTGEKILTAGALPYLVDERECHFSTSIGITVFGAELGNGLEALQQGEIAMTQAKEAGRNTIRFFSPELQANVNARVHLENELRKAIKAEEFELYFQPQVRGDRLIGSEALIRWNHPQRGVLAPGAFVELAEDTGLILPMGNWAFWKACEHVAAWAGKNRSGDAPVAVNISGKQFSQPDFVARVLATLDSTGANPASIKLELTETSLVKDFEDAVAKMTELKSHGLKFSIDDFGTGYSSLAYLKSLPLDQLKIDRAFVKDILVDGPSGAIAQAIVSLGHSMRFSVIAEGVETVEQRDFLLGIGCNSFQGYLYSRPVPADEFERTWFQQSD